MKDPKPARAGSGDPEPATPSFEEATPAVLAQHQFPSRRARRTAELTGMIPIVPLPTAVAKPAAVAPPVVRTMAGVQPNAQVPAVAQSATVEHGSGSTGASEPSTAGAGPQPDGGAPSESAEAANDAEASGPAEANDAPNKDTAPDTANTPDSSDLTGPAEPATGATSSAATDAATPAAKPLPAKVPASSFSAKRLPALVPPVPVPSGPIAPIPAGMADDVEVKVRRTPKAGRNLPAAIVVGVSLLAVVVGSLLFYPVAFVVVATAFAVVGVWEVTRAIAGRGIHAPMTPVMIGTLAMPASAYFAGAEGLLFAFVAACAAVLLWRCLDSEPGAIHSIFAGIFVLTWVPFLLSFVFLMLRDTQPPTTGLTLDLTALNPGVLQVIIMLFLVVANDTFGYLVGVLFGKHPMAPKISPKKSWEGFAGSMGGAILVAIPATIFLLHDQWWVGLVLAVGMVLAGTSGDFAESMVKRELGIKDMSNLLPGHGGMMDRLDSILFAAPVAFITLSVLGSM